MKQPTEITVREAAKLTGYSRQQIYNLVTDGQVEARKPGGWELWIDRASLLAYAARRAKSASAK